MEKQLNIPTDQYNCWKDRHLGIDQEKLYSLSSGFYGVKVMGSQVKLKGHFTVAVGNYDKSKQSLTLKITYRTGMWFALLFLTAIGLFFTINIIINPQVTIQEVKDPPLFIRICGSFLLFWVFVLPIQLLFRTKALLWKSIEKSFDKLQAK